MEAWAGEGHSSLQSRDGARPRVLIIDDEPLLRRLLRRCLRPPWGSEAVRAHAHLRLSGIATRRGQHVEAHDEAQQAVRLFSAEYPPQPQFVLLARYHEIRALVSARRQPDARCLLEELGPAPAGDYLRAQHYVTELYVALGDNRVPFLDTALWERTELALRTPSSGALLGLCAWGYFKLDDREMAAHLLALAEKRRDEPLDQTMPLLSRWMTRDARPAAAAEREPQREAHGEDETWVGTMRGGHAGERATPGSHAASAARPRAPGVIAGVRGVAGRRSRVMRGRWFR